MSNHLKCCKCGKTATRQVVVANFVGNFCDKHYKEHMDKLINQSGGNKNGRHPKS